ncbi:MAG: GNAT family N-acetyltransferase [Armatimonadetes bacterium]|nr:GNAT family N-acetyltransferase [Armatimonadota bacterium]
MPQFTTKPLTPETWTAFAALVQKHNGVWGGCWCIAFHEKPGSENQEKKHCLVMEGKAHAALVFDGEACVGWCQFGTPEELPRIKHRKQYLSELEQLPDWRITCCFVDKDYRGQGVITAGIQGVLEQVAELGGGIVESYPEDVSGRKTSSSFLYNATVDPFERLGFERQRRIGMHHWVVVKRVLAK